MAAIYGLVALFIGMIFPFLMAPQSMFDTVGGGSASQDSGSPILMLQLALGLLVCANMILAFAPKKPVWWWLILVALGYNIVAGGPCGLVSLIILIGWIGKPVKDIYFGEHVFKRDQMGSG
ncbi:MAG: hypothetical protein ACKVQS_03890 [Fimbriimonadaceae bacterium]